MIRRYAHQGVTWIDLESPSPEDVAEIAKEFAIAPSLAEELLQPTAKPRVDIYPDCVYAVFHFPASRHTREQDMAYELDVILGKDYLITTHYLPMAAIEDFARSLEAASLMKKKSGAMNGAYLLLELATLLYHESESELDALDDTISHIEESIFGGRERKMVTTISKASRELLSVKRVLGNHAETLTALETASAQLLGEPVHHYFRSIATLHYRAYNRALAMVETMTELRDTNIGLLSTRQNEIVKNLTIIASIMLPLTLVANIFSMNTATLPIVGAPNDFWIIVGVMAVITLLLALYFKFRKWF